jgi:hypothetical protein
MVNSTSEIAVACGSPGNGQKCIPISCFVYVLNNHCHRVTTQLQLINIFIIIIIIIMLVCKPEAKTPLEKHVRTRMWGCNIKTG